MKGAFFYRKNVQRAIGALGVLVAFALLLVFGPYFVAAFTGPSSSGGTGSGAIGVDADNNLSIGTSTPLSTTKLYVVGSTADTTAYGLKVTKSDGTVIFSVRNDGLITGGGGVGTVATATAATANYIPKFTANGGATIQNSQIIDTGTYVSVATTTADEKLTVGGSIEVIGSTGGSNRLVLKDTSGSPRTWEWYPNQGGANTLSLYERVSGFVPLLISYDGTLTVNGGTGKINVGTIDPVYDIGGVKYATYVSGMVGQKEENTGNVQLACNGDTCFKVLDLAVQPVGSDLWLFAKATDLKDHMDDLVVMLTPAFNGRVWYEVNGTQLTLYGDKAGKVSYRLTAPRFDSEKWTNFADPKATGFVISE